MELEEGSKLAEEGQREGTELMSEAEEMLAILRGFSSETYFGCKAYHSLNTS